VRQIITWTSQYYKFIVFTNDKKHNKLESFTNDTLEIAVFRLTDDTSTEDEVPGRQTYFGSF